MFVLYYTFEALMRLISMEIFLKIPTYQKILPQQKNARGTLAIFFEFFSIFEKIFI